jgi:hypothetical protein
VLDCNEANTCAAAGLTETLTGRLLCPSCGWLAPGERAADFEEELKMYGTPIAATSSPVNKIMRTAFLVVIGCLLRTGWSLLKARVSDSSGVFKSNLIFDG